LGSPASDKPKTLTGIVKPDETFILESFKGRRSDLPPSTGGQRSICSRTHAYVKVLEVCLQALLVLRPCQPIDAWRGGLLQSEEPRSQNIDADMMERGQRLCSIPGYSLSYASLRM
jgi:hypothetical protein